jgi:hypothetical protein
MKKFITIALAIAFIMVAAPELNAGVSIGIGVGFPAVYGYPAYYPYGYGCYPYSYYGAPYYRPTIYYSAVFGPYYWWHGQRVFLRHHHFRH